MKNIFIILMLHAGSSTGRWGKGYGVGKGVGCQLQAASVVSVNLSSIAADAHLLLRTVSFLLSQNAVKQFVYAAILNTTTTTTRSWPHFLVHFSQLTV